MIPNISVDTWAVASSLFVQVLVPIAAGLLANYRYPEAADLARPVMGQIANITLTGLLAVNLVRLPEIMGLFGSGAIFAVLVIIAVGLWAGYNWPGLPRKEQKTLALVSGQRNFAAAFVIAQGSFAGQNRVFIMILMASILSMVITLIAAGEFKRRGLKVSSK